MRHLLLASMSMLMAAPAPAAAPAEESSLIEQVGRPIREEMLDRFAAWRPLLFIEGDAADAVTAKFGKRYDALESRVAGESHPGALARSRHEFQDLLDDALRERYKKEQPSRFLNRGYGDYRVEKTALVERTVAGRKSARAASSRALAVADAAAPAPVLPPLEAVSSGGFFDGANIPGTVMTAPTLAVAEPLKPLESRAFAHNLIVPGLASSALPLRRPPPPSVEFYLADARTRAGIEDYREVRRYLIANGAQAAVVDAAIAQALRKGVNPLIPLAVCMQESRCAATEKDKQGRIVPVESSAGAIGAFQIMPDMHGASAVELQNNALNVSKGIGLLIYLNEKFDDLDLTFASYNAGAGAVQKAGGIPNYGETKDFVKKVAANVETLRRYVWDNFPY